MKLNISDPKMKKTYSVDLGESAVLIGKKLNSVVNGNELGYADYEFKITGGSDQQGFPMKKIPGTYRKSLLLTKGPGFRSTRKGLRKLKTVRGDTISLEISQVNCVVTKYGAKPIKEEPQA